MEIAIKGLTKTYGLVKALDGIETTVRSNKVTALVGANGSGKTTLLSIMAGRGLPDEGDVLYDGTSLLSYPERVGWNVGFMPDSLPDSWLWDVHSYLDSFARGYGYQGEDRLGKVKQILEYLAITELSGRKFRELSKGQKQRVSMARVLLGEPDVLLLDEPAAGMDPLARVDLYHIIRQLAKDGKTIVISSHILSELEDIADDALFLDAGKLRHSGAIAEQKHAETDILLTFSAAVSQDALTALPHCSKASQDERGSWVVTIAGGEDELYDFMSALFQAKLPVATYNRRAISLSSLFLQVAKK